MQAELWCVTGRRASRCADDDVSGSPAGWCTRWLTDAGGEAPGDEVVGAPDWLALTAGAARHVSRGRGSEGETREGEEG